MTRRRRTRSNRARRRGAAYVLVLSVGVLLSVVGMGVLTVTRAASRTATQAADVDEAASLAESGVAWGISAMTANASWRTTYVHNVETTPKAMGRGTVSFKLVAESGTSLASGNVRLYGIGRVGAATRVHSVLMTGTGASLDVLKAAAHAAGDLTISDNVTPSGGAVSTSGLLFVKAGKILTGDAEYGSLKLDGTITGGMTQLSAAKPMPAATAFDTYKAKATTLAFASIASGNITKKVLSPGTNTVVAAAGLNADGVYYVKVPSTGTLTISTSRIVGTLVVELDPGGKFAISGANAWGPARSDYPALVIKGSSSSSTVTLSGSTSSLAELSNTTNFNPAGTPYPYPGGTTNTGMTDSYTSQLSGLVHVIGSAVPTKIQSNFSLKGAILTDGPLESVTGVKLVADPTLVANPPEGYTAATVMTPSAGSWRWDKTP